MDLTGKAVVVTGAAGFIGSHLVDALALEPVRSVTAVDNLSLGRKSNLTKALRSSKVAFVELDVSDRHATLMLFRDIRPDVVFNLAVVPLPASLVRPAESFAETTMCCLSLCEAWRAGLLGRLVHFSSSEVYGSCVRAPMAEDHPLEGTTPYAASKVASDLLVASYGRTFGMSYLIVRPFNNYGPRQNMAEFAGIVPTATLRILRGEPVIIFGDGSQTRDYIYVSDTVAGAIRLTKADEAWGRIVNLGSEHELSMRDVVKAIGTAVGREPIIEFREPRAGDVRRHVADVSLARELIKFEPSISFADGIRATVDWYENFMIAELIPH